jgi:hypothetical protein
MGCFNDLPKDVLWLIFRHRICIIGLRLRFHPAFYEEPYEWKNSFSKILSETTCDLALLSKRCLKIIKSKTVSFGDAGWLFKKGALTN